MIREHELREQLTALLSGAISLAQFEEWFSVASWSMHKDSDQSAIDLASSVHVLLSDRDEHAIDELQLRAELQSLLKSLHLQPQLFSAKISIEADRIARALYIETTAQPRQTLTVLQPVALS